MTTRHKYYVHSYETCEACEGKGATSVWTHRNGSAVYMRCMVCDGKGEIKARVPLTVALRELQERGMLPTVG